MLRAKTLDRALLVSDLVMLAGLPPGKYETPVGGSVELHAAGRLNVAGTNFLAGATATLKDAVAYVAANTSYSLGDAVRLATQNPGRYVGSRGMLAVGAPADLIRFQWQPGAATLTMDDVVVQGMRA